MADDLKEILKNIPKERTHPLVCKRSGGALFPKETGVEPVIFLVAEMDGVDHLFYIDLRDAIVLKRSTDRTIESVEKKDPAVMYKEQVN